MDIITQMMVITTTMDGMVQVGTTVLTMTTHTSITVGEETTATGPITGTIMAMEVTEVMVVTAAVDMVDMAADTVVIANIS